jgi:hypothetical protein
MGGGIASRKWNDEGVRMKRVDRRGSKECFAAEDEEHDDDQRTMVIIFDRRINLRDRNID